ncbi:MAG: hypothetical protein AAF318_07555 [Pseudomonadota bacterium]
MAAWIEDAQILAAGRELASAQNSLLLRTRDVETFLGQANLHSCALVAPKGFGKTFILKMKRVLLQNDSYRTLPSGVIVDRPKDRPPVLSQDVVALLEVSATWETIWQVAIAIALIKGHRDDKDGSAHLATLSTHFAETAPLNNILKNPYVEQPFEIVHTILSSSRSHLFAVLNSASMVTAAFARMTKATALFIDNVDEYLEHYISNRMYERSSFSRQYIDVWHAGQIGLLLALRRLNGINPHVKVFASLRKEAYQAAGKTEPSFANLRAFAQELRYTRGDIETIIRNNVFAEPKSNLADPKTLDRHDKSDAAAAVDAFTGPAARTVSNSGTGKDEPVLSYWLRHATLRPRDAVAIGAELSKIRPADRTREKMRAVINTVAADRVQTIFSEVAPFFDDLVPEIFPRVVSSNVMTREALERAADRYRAEYSEEFGCADPASLHPFCALYAMGLIGVVLEDRDHPGRLVQDFAPLGVAPFGDHHILPMANTYLLHPAFSDYIVSKNVTFLPQVNRHNVIGDGLEWRPEENVRFVAVGDIASYRAKVMASVGAASTFEAFWQGVLTDHAADLDLVEAKNGDSLALADRSPARLLTAVKAIGTSLRHSTYRLDMRFGAHCGHWALTYDADGVAHANINPIVGTAARLEACAAPGTTLVTDDFLSLATLDEGQRDRLGLVPAEPEHLSVPDRLDGGAVDIAKPGEPAEAVTIWAMPA